MFWDNIKKQENKEMTKYKFKELLIYSSDEWMARSAKKYRTVFDKAETTYIRCELAFYNKLFDEEDWQCKVTLKAFDISGGKREQLCSLDKEVPVLKDENIVQVRDGWGNKELGAYWMKGEYVWEAYLDDVLIGSKNFFVNNVGLVTPHHNPYFEVDHIAIYNADADGWKLEPNQRVYYKEISKNDTKYLWAEVKIKNTTNLDWNYELFLNYYDDAGQHKAIIPRVGKIEAGKLDWSYTFDIGWGTDDGGSWKDDKYSIELVFMDCLVAATTFNCGDAFVEGQLELIDPAMATSLIVDENTEDKEDKRTLEDLLAELDKLVGLQNVKQHIHDQITLINFNKLRKEQGLEDENKFSLHSVAIGNPGTGKTTVMRLLGKIYHKLGMLSKGHVHEVDRVDLVGEYIGQTAPKVQKCIDEARGGILFIDEAYALSRAGEDSKDYGKEVIEILIKEMSDGPGDIAIFVAGYPKEMRTFLESNPGLKSRFSNYFTFEDYLPDELQEIAYIIAERNKLTIAEDARLTLKDGLTEAFRSRDKSFGNARYVEGAINSAKKNMALRLMQLPDQKSLDKETISTITQTDIAKVFQENKRKQLKLEVDKEDLFLALDELNTLVGLQNVKQEIDELIRLIKYYNDIGKDVLNKFSLHSVFLGNPGTGKTTVARIFGKIFKALGILERGHLVEVDKEALVAGYVGQTAIKTNAKIEEAIGGVLFIDEAYSLTNSGNNGFGNEAVETLLKRMEDLRGQFIVIAAGYTDNMNDFLQANPGLNSRFDKKYLFEDYKPEEMMQIADTFLKPEDLVLNAEANEHLLRYFTELYEHRDKFFGNGRTVRQTILEAIKNQHLRMSNIPAAQRNMQDLQTITIDDVNEFKYNDDLRINKPIGFRLNQS